MAKQPNNQEQIPQPLMHQPEETVMNVYPIPGTDIGPDYGSQDTMGEYLFDRFKPDEGPKTHVVLEATGRTLPGIRRVPTGPKEVTRLRRTDEWLISPKAALIATIGSALLFNGVANHDTIDESAQWVGHEIYRVIHPVHNKQIPVTTTTQVPGAIKDIRINAGVASTDVTGTHISLNAAQVESLGKQIEVAKAQGGTVQSVEVTGETSDDWGGKGDAAFGQPDVENARLGVAVARAAYDQVKSELDAAGLAGVPTTFSQHETVLPEATVQALTVQAKANGYSTLEAAVKAVDHGELREGDLHDTIQRDLISNRGESIDVKVSVPGESTTKTDTTKVTIFGHDNPPHVPKPHPFWFIPIPFIRRRERYKTIKETHSWEFTPSAEIMTPTIIHEDADTAWVRIRPEAVNKDGTLVKNPWAYTRKYEHLLRDSRISEVLRADFVNNAGEDKALRVMFVDETPAPETINVFTELLKKFAAMEHGKIGDRISGIFVYPSENAGTEHNEPKRISVGVDKQDHAGVVGKCIPVLDLVELHMPTKVDVKELEALLASFEGPAFTMAHEVAGHATDENDTPLRLRRVAARGIPNAHILDGNPWAEKMQPLQKVLSKLPKRKQDKKSPIEFDISYPVVDKHGQTVTMSARVAENDPRLAHATHSTIVGYEPTQYAGTEVAEHYAETAAATTTGIAIPYHEAVVDVPRLKTDDGKHAVFADGYRPDTRGQKLFTDSVGAEAGVYPVSFKDEPVVKISYGGPEDDSLLREEMIRTRRIATLTPRQMVAILVPSVRRKKA